MSKLWVNVTTCNFRFWKCPCRPIPSHVIVNFPQVTHNKYCVHATHILWVSCSFIMSRLGQLTRNNARCSHSVAHHSIGVVLFTQYLLPLKWAILRCSAINPHPRHIFWYLRSICVPFPHLRSICVPSAFHLGSICVPSGFHLGSIRIPYAFHPSSIWVPPGFHLRSICVLFPTRSQAPGTWYLVPGTMYQVPGTWSQVPGTRYLVPAYYQAPGTRYPVPGTRYWNHTKQYTVSG